MQWTEIVVTVKREYADVTSDVCTAFAHGGLYIEDYADLERQVQAIAHVDLIEESLLNEPRDIVKIHLYVSPDENAVQINDALRGALLKAGVNASLETHGVHQEDWENAWKAYYHPIEIGERLAVAPSWEEYVGKNRTVMRLDPGMAFGTGTHETTALCLEELDVRIHGGEKVLDIGCGSGILAVAALLLGAQSALGIDIDPMAVRTAKENALLNGVQQSFAAHEGNLAQHTNGTYNVITANIVADAIIGLAPAIPALLTKGGVFLASGIITQRTAEVTKAIEDAGLCVASTKTKKGWVLLVCTVRE